MDRRTLLKLSSAALLAGISGAAPALARSGQGRMPKIVVIGAGIMGAAIAYRLAMRGAQVTIVEAKAPAAGGTGGSFAWIMPRPVAGAPSLYTLYATAVGAWRWLDDEFAGKLAMQWGGYVGWQPPGAQADEIERVTKAQLAYGAGTRMIEEAELQRLVPGIRPGPFGKGMFAADSGSLEPRHGVETLLAAAPGLVLKAPSSVTGFRTSGDKLVAVVTETGEIDADVVVLAAGSESTALGEQIGVRVPLKTMAGSLAHTKPYKHVLDRAIAAPGAVIKQDASGRFVTGPAFSGAPNADTSEGYGRELIANAAAFYPALKNAELDYMTLGAVAVPEDAKPISGFAQSIPNLYVSVTLSGITFAPLFANYAATEILDGVSIDILSDYRPARFS